MGMAATWQEPKSINHTVHSVKPGPRIWFLRMSNTRIIVETPSASGAKSEMRSSNMNILDGKSSKLVLHNIKSDWRGKNQTILKHLGQLDWLSLTQTNWPNLIFNWYYGSLGPGAPWRCTRRDGTMGGTCSGWVVGINTGQLVWPTIIPSRFLHCFKDG